jgi:hypothetical protein
MVIDLNERVPFSQEDTLCPLALRPIFLLILSSSFVILFPAKRKFLSNISDIDQRLNSYLDIPAKTGSQ